MTTYYVDYEGAAGSGDGSSFANRAGKISDLNSGTQPYAGSNNNNEIRIKSSPAPTVLKTGVKVTKRAADSKQGYGHRSLGTVTYSTTEGATSINNTSHKLVTGDWISICNNTQYHTSNTYANRMHLNGQWKVTVTDSNNFKLDGYTAPNTTVAGGSTGNFHNCTGAVLEIANPPWKEVACSAHNREKWTASSNVTTYDPYQSQSTWSTTYCHMPPGSDQINISSSFTTGKAAYYELPSTLDLSGYQQLSWKVIWRSGNRQLGSSANGQLSLKLCTDTTGDTVAHTCTFDMRRLPLSDRWVEMTVDLGSNMNSAIKSIALYVDDRNSTTGDYNINLQNIIACKASSAADSVTHKSLIGLNTTAMKSWYGIGYFSGTGLHLAWAKYYDRRSASTYYSSGDAVWWDQSHASTTIYKREPIYGPPCNTSSSQGNISTTPHKLEYSNIGSGTNSGGLSGYKVVSGGWNRTDMSSQTNDGTGLPCTILDYSGFGGGFAHSSGQGYHHIRDMMFVRCAYGPYLTTNHGVMTNIRSHFVTQEVKNSWNAVSGIGLTQFTHCEKPAIMNDNVSSDHNFGPWYVTQASCFPFDQGMPNINRALRGITWSDINTEFSKGFQVGYKNASTDADPACTITNFKGGYPWAAYDQYGFGTTNTGENYVIDVGNLTITGQSGIRWDARGKLKVNDYTYKKYDTNDGVSEWSNTEPYYSIKMSSSAVEVEINGGEIDHHVDIDSGHLKLTGVTDTSTDAHEVTGGTSELSIKNAGGVSGANTYYGDGFKIEPETSIRNTASGLAWKFSLLNTSSVGKHELGKFAVNSGGTVAVKLYMRKNAASAKGSLVIKQNSDIGMTGNSTGDTSSISSDTWTEISTSFQPTGAGIIVVEFHISGTSTSDVVYIDDMSITQS